MSLSQIAFANGPAVDHKHLVWCGQLFTIANLGKTWGDVSCCRFCPRALADLGKRDRQSRENFVNSLPQPLCQSGGIGRRAGFKIQ